MFINRKTKHAKLLSEVSKANWEAYASYWLKDKDLTMSHYLKKQIITKQQKQMNKQTKKILRNVLKQTVHQKAYPSVSTKLRHNFLP